MVVRSKKVSDFALLRSLRVGAHGRDCLKIRESPTRSVGAVREPPEIRALLEAPLPTKSRR